jgi:uncharacterized protein YggE
MCNTAGNVQGVSVTGVGKASAAPDIARTSVGVEVRSASVEQATADATARMNAVVQAIKLAGVAESDLRTRGLSIGFEQEPVPVPPTPLPATGGGAQQDTAAQLPRGFYRVSNMLEVTIRKLDTVGRVLKAATDAGANSVWGITFEIENNQALVSQARARAVQRAKQAATELAGLAGVKLGPVLSLIENEQGGYGGPQAMEMRASNAEMPVQRGEITLTYNVQMVYATER